MTPTQVRIIALFSVWLTGINQACAQSRKPFYSREISLVADNDIILFQDYYYTAGQDIVYRRLIRPQHKMHRLLSRNDSTKTIVQYRAGAKIFTPYDITTADTRKLDRPYAGWDYGDITFVHFPNVHTAHQYQIQLGWVGPSSGLEEVQNWIHSMTHFTLAKGWNYQIPDEPVVNLSYTRWQSWKIFSDVDVVSQFMGQIGTGSNRIFQELSLRLMQFNPINNSIFTNSRLSWDTKEVGRKKEMECFIFIGMGVNYVFSNVFIEGSLFSDSNTNITSRLEPWVFQNRFGLMISKHDVSWSLTFYQLSEEMLDGHAHGYGSMAFAMRF